MICACSSDEILSWLLLDISAKAPAIEIWPDAIKFQNTVRYEFEATRTLYLPVYKVAPHERFWGRDALLDILITQKRSERKIIIKGAATKSVRVSPQLWNECDRDAALWCSFCLVRQRHQWQSSYIFQTLTIVLTYWQFHLILLLCRSLIPVYVQLVAYNDTCSDANVNIQNKNLTPRLQYLTLRLVSRKW